jgi:hypothetical protein
MPEAEMCIEVRSEPAAGARAATPLTAEYRAIFEAGLADMAAGGTGLDPSYICIPPGMPRSEASLAKGGGPDAITV